MDVHSSQTDTQSKRTICCASIAAQLNGHTDVGWLKYYLFRVFYLVILKTGTEC